MACLVGGIYWLLYPSAVFGGLVLEVIAAALDAPGVPRPPLSVDCAALDQTDITDVFSSTVCGQLGDTETPVGKS